MSTPTTPRNGAVGWAHGLSAGAVPAQQRNGKTARRIKHHHGRVGALVLEMGRDQPGDGTAGAHAHEGPAAWPFTGEQQLQFARAPGLVIGGGRNPIDQAPPQQPPPQRQGVGVVS